MSRAQYERHRMLCQSFLSTVSFLILFWVSGVHGAHSRHRARYVVQRENEFDRRTTLFTDEGRLLQMEYGMEAAERGSTVTVIKLEKNEEAGEGNEDESSDNAIIVLVKRKNMYKIDDHVWMVSTGVMGDIFSMAEYLRSFCQDFRGIYGEAPTIREVAQHSALIQHSLTMHDHYRPLGTTVSIFGVDPHSTKQRVFRTDPGGVLEECRYCVGGKNQALIMKDLTKELPKIMEKEKRNKVLGMVKAAVNSLHLGSEETVDVWILRLREAQCFLNVDKENCNNIHLDA